MVSMMKHSWWSKLNMSDAILENLAAVFVGRISKDFYLQLWSLQNVKKVYIRKRASTVFKRFNHYVKKRHFAQQSLIWLQTVVCGGEVSRQCLHWLSISTVVQWWQQAGLWSVAGAECSAGTDCRYRIILFCLSSKLNI